MPSRPDPAGSAGRFFALLGLAWVTASCRADAPPETPAATRDTLPGGTVVVRHGALPAAPSDTLHPEVRIGAVEGEPHETFGNVRGLAVTPAGDLWVLDYQAAEIRAFGLDGTFRGVIASRGEGPGELQEANGMKRGPEGVVWVKDHRRWAMVGFDPDGREVARHPTVTRSYGYIWDGTIDDRGVFWEPTGHADDYQRPTETGVTEATGRRYYKSYDPGTETYDSLYLGEYTSRSFAVIGDNFGSFFGLPFAPSTLTAFDPAGFIWSAESERYAVVRIDASSGDTVLVVEADLQGPPVTDEDRERWMARLERFGEQEAASIRRQLEPMVPERKPVLEAISVDAAGRLWVRRTGGADDLPAYDVFDGDGERLASLHLGFRPAPGLHPVVRDGTLWTVVQNELDVPFVVGASLPVGLGGG